MTPSKEQAKVAVRAVLEHVKQVLSQPEIGPISEADTRANFIDKYIYNLGYDGIGTVVREYYVKDLKEFIDYLLRIDNMAQVAVEAKSLRSDLTDANAAQLMKYAAIEGIEWCVLTNGRELHIYNQYLKGGVQDKLVLKLDLLAFNSDAEFDAVFEQFWLLSRQSMAQAAIATLMEQVTLDRAIRQLMLDPNSATVRGIRSDLKARFQLSPKSEQVVAWLKDRILGRPQLSVVTPSPHLDEQRPVNSIETKPRSSVSGSLQRLIEAGLLQAGASLVARHRGVDYTAVVEPDGRLRIGRVLYNSPSSAGAAITQSAINGWRFWHYGPQPLSALREALVNDDVAMGS